MTGLIRFSPLVARSLGNVPFADFDRALGSIASQLFNDVGDNDLSLRADVAETDAAYVIRFDVPGVAKDSINVTVEDKLVKVEVKFASTAVEGEKSLRSERLVGEASRSFRFPVALDSDAASATHELGVLSLTLPKKAATAQKRLTIN
ncbi:MAG: Hsp20/alpha crystallin family protein [Casimicrobium sp.]